MSLRLRLSDADLVRTRLTYAPFWDIACAALTPPGEGAHAAERERRLLEAARPVAALPEVRLLASGRLPPSLAVVPEPGEPLLATLDRLELGAAGQAFLAAWDRGFGEAWPEIDAIHQANFVRAGLEVVTDGPRALLDGLGSGTRLDDDALVIPGAGSAERPLPPGGLALVASVFAPDPCLAGIAGDAFLVVHPPAGRALLWLEPSPELGDPIAEVVGPVRAQILRVLRTPRSTTGVGFACSIAANTASYHLNRLRQAGLVRLVRSGRNAYYSLSDRGASFLALWPGEERDARPGHRHVAGRTPLGHCPDAAWRTGRTSGRAALGSGPSALLRPGP